MQPSVVLSALLVLIPCAFHLPAVHGQDENQNGPCTVCLDGTNNITRPDYLIELPGFPPVTCQTATFLASAVSNTSDECQQARLLGSPLCGCPVLEENPCLLCPYRNSSPTVRTIADVGVTTGSNVVPSLGTVLFGDQIAEPTCEMVQAVLLNYDDDSDVCDSSRSEASSTCGCARENITETSQGSEVSFPLANETGIAEVTRCSLCPNGEPIASPEREIPGFFVPTCDVLDTVTSALPHDSPDCSNAQQLGVYCGCPAPSHPCSLCTDGRPIPKPDALVEAMVLPGNYTPTCSVFEGLVGNFPYAPQLCVAAQGAAMTYCGCPPLEEESCVMCPGGIPKERWFEYPTVFDFPVQCGFLEVAQVGFAAKSENCFFYEQIAHTCGCRDFVRTYGGAETVVGQIVLSWAPRLPALLSLAGSLTIINVARKTPYTMYHQLIMSISAADVVSSVGWFMSSWPVPPVGIDADIWGANGNPAICKAQGASIVWSTASHWLNLSLSLYYKLVIVNGWRERQFTRWVRALLLGLPFIMSTFITVLSFDHIVPSGIGCSFLPFPRATEAVPFYLLIVTPLCSILLAVIVLTLWISWKFSLQMRAADKWRFANRRDAFQKQRGSVGTFRSTLSSWAVGVSKHSLEGSVLRQSIFYLIAFCSSAPVVLISTIMLANFYVSFWVTLATLILTPLQGFTNALIFFRPRIFDCCTSNFRKMQLKAAQAKARSGRKKHDQEDPTESNLTETNNGPRLGDLGILRSTHVKSTGDEPDSKGELADESTNSFDQREHVEFLRSHIHGSVAFEGVEDDVSMDLAELEPQGEPELEGSIVVGSLVLPSFRGSSRWDVNNWEPEVSDFVCDEEDVVHSDS